MIIDHVITFQKLRQLKDMIMQPVVYWIIFISKIDIR